jgi:hypothetical protein
MKQAGAPKASRSGFTRETSGDTSTVPPVPRGFPWVTPTFA